MKMYRNTILPIRSSAGIFRMVHLFYFVIIPEQISESVFSRKSFPLFTKSTWYKTRESNWFLFSSNFKVGRSKLLIVIPLFCEKSKTEQKQKMEIIKKLLPEFISIDTEHLTRRKDTEKLWFDWFFTIQQAHKAHRKPWNQLVGQFENWKSSSPYGQCHYLRQIYSGNRFLYIGLKPWEGVSLSPTWMSG